MQTSAGFERRQIWNVHSTTTSTLPSQCTPFTLPANGVLSLGPANIVTLASNVVFQPQCTGRADAFKSTNADLNDPFYASSTPQVYVVAAATALAWVLVAMLMISPRTFYANGSSGSTTFIGGRGIIGGANGGNNPLVGVGSRPWLQKAATLTVAIALTIATSDTLKVSARHYHSGGIDGNSLREEVENSMEIRITQAISDIFVWLALVQTLIRLFPRHREKVLIKWIGFALVILDTTFSCLNSFLVGSSQRPRHFVDAIPALSYLFELAVNLLYAAWVLYYSMTKRRYAFWHSKMKNISIIALLSLVSILTPVVFFVTDVTLPDVAGWGDYFRWVGAAAASVVVWEWVERIEALERDEKKDGILGREIFDGDEMLDVGPGTDITYVRRRNDNYILRRHDGRDDTPPANAESGRRILAGASRRLPYHRTETVRQTSSSTAAVTDGANASSQQRKQIGFERLPRPGARSSIATPPLQAMSPPSRADTTSAASTLYIVRQDGTDAPQPVRRRAGTTPVPANALSNVSSATANVLQEEDETQPSRWRSTSTWHTVSNPFKRKRTTPPAEVRAAMNSMEQAGKSQIPSLATPSKPAKARTQPLDRWDVKARLGAFAAEHTERLRDRAAGRHAEVELPWTVVPAQPRGAAAWSPGFANARNSSSTPSSATPVTDTAHACTLDTTGEHNSRDSLYEQTNTNAEDLGQSESHDTRQRLSSAPHEGMRQQANRSWQGPSQRIESLENRDDG